MKFKIYIDTTIPSFYHEERPDIIVQARREITRSWWHGPGTMHDLVTSVFTLDELNRGDYPAKEACLELVEDLPLLELDPHIREIIRAYIENKLMPAEEAGDAAHLAVASFHKIDFLLTWNLKHLANVNKVHHIRVLNTRMGLFVPDIVTPDFFSGEE